ncbi:hypothetical protein EK21DRAFT_90173 [Setomelanomma holmii]|uniref:ferric-chelate reductase (NADPH) n=1 Tax=Setomelanomma holmii TaxID=210430 RepID=A0A9P4H985_9PLEO|nr:hypothetical protein EK21DRAFT_90173 [Setomelanomma holmii]
MIPLFFGGRRGLMNDRILRIQTSEQALVHRWMGRICVIQGIVHGIISISDHSPSIPQIIYIFEIFLKSHIISALGLIGLLWFHIPLRYHLSTICLGIASGLWMVQEIYWIACLGVQNIGSRSPRICDAVIYAGPNGSAEAMSLTVCLKGSPTITSGQFLYLTIPGLSRHHAGFAQAHPYAIAWAENSEVTMFIQRRNGFSNDLFNVPNIGASAIIADGPYGSPQQLHTYDKVLFIASGIGIAAHLVAIKRLLEAHEDRSAQARRVTLIWFLETSGIYLIRSGTSCFQLTEEVQEQLASRLLHQLLAIDKRQIFTLALYVPPRAPADDSDIVATERYFRTDQPLNLGWYIDKEASSEAGDMMVSVCGTPHFEDAFEPSGLAVEIAIHRLVFTIDRGYPGNGTMQIAAERNFHRYKKTALD